MVIPLAAASMIAAAAVANGLPALAAVRRVIMKIADRIYQWAAGPIEAEGEARGETRVKLSASLGVRPGASPAHWSGPGGRRRRSAMGCRFTNRRRNGRYQSHEGAPVAGDGGLYCAQAIFIRRLDRTSRSELTRCREQQKEHSYGPPGQHYPRGAGAGAPGVF